MRKWHRVSLGLVLGLAASAGLARVLIGSTTAQSAASPPEKSGSMMSDVLVTSGVANNDIPAAVTLDLSNSRVSPKSRLELSVTPEKISPNETFMVVVSPAGEPDKPLGSFAFFPPPRAGETRKFLVDVPEVADDKAAQAKTKVSVELVPVNAREALANSSLRVVGARVVGN